MKYSSLKSFPIDEMLLKITCLAWLVAKVMSYKVWISDRLFPIVPTFDFLSLPNYIHLGLYLLSLLGILIIFFKPHKKIIAAVLVIEVFACLLDQTRWQPWQYQYLLMFSFFFFAKDTKQFIQLCYFLIGCTYFFSGLHKFDGSFLYTFWDNSVLRKTLHLDAQIIKNPFIHYLGIIPCLIEILIGFGIIFFHNKKYFFLMAIMMHLLILFMFGPFGSNHNNIIMPWNIAMILYAVLFLREKKLLQFNRSFFVSKINKVVFLLIGILPFGSFVGIWDNYLSFNLYSGNTYELAICISEKSNNPELLRYTSQERNEKYCNGSYIIKANKWALGELNVPYIPEERYFIKMKVEFKNKFPDLDISLVYYQYPYKSENIKEVP